MNVMKKPIRTSTFKPHSQRLALESRLVFDGAMAATVADVQPDNIDNPVTDNTSTAAPVIEPPVNFLPEKPAPVVDFQPSTDNTTQSPTFFVEPNPLESMNIAMTPVMDVKGDTASTVIVIDPRADNAAALLANPPANTKILTLDTSRDGFQQVADYLQTRHDVTDLHLLTWTDGTNQWLGNKALTNTMESSVSNELMQWGDGVVDNANIVFHGATKLSAGWLSYIDALTGATASWSQDTDIAHTANKPLPQPTEIVFIENNLPDYQTLVNGVNPNAEVYLLDSTKDGLAQMAKILNGRSEIDAISIISHGAEASVGLGTLTLTSQNIHDHAVDLTAIGNALKPDADILLYGCNVAKGSDGAEFIAALAQATRADIAASTDLTGAANQGGDWVLESKTGFIEASIPFAIETLSNYAYVLPAGMITFSGAFDGTSFGSDNIATDGEIGSTDIAGIVLQTFAIGGNNSTVLTTNGNLEYHDAFNYVQNIVTWVDTFVNPIYGMDIKSSDGSNFKLQSVNFFDWGSWDGHSWTIEAFDNGVSKGTATFHGNMTGVYVPLASGGVLTSIFDNIDEVRIHNANNMPSWFGLNDILIDHPVVVNTVPTFVQAGAGTLNINENAAATDIKSLLHISDTDASQTETWTQNVAPSHGTLSFGSATASSGSADIITGGTITYTPTGGYAGTDTFTIQVSDGNGGTVNRVINVNVTPLTPSAPDLIAFKDTGSSSTDNITNAALLNFTGSSAAGDSSSKVWVFIDANANGVYNGGVDPVASAFLSNGSWTLNGLSTAAVADGTYNFYAFTTTSANTLASAYSSALSITIDKTLPTYGTVTPPAMITTAGGASSTFTITYNDGKGSGIDTTSIGATDVTVAGTTISNGTWSAGTATYTINAPGGSWDFTDNGTYTIDIAGSQVKDIAGNSVATATTVGSFIVNIPVTNTNPVSSANTGLTVLEDAAITTITTAKLQVTDTEQAASALTYTVTTATTKGALTNNGTTLGVGNTFTQADINNGYLKFTPNFNANGSDSFTFSVSDSAGGTLSGQTFNFTITPVVDVNIVTGIMPVEGAVGTFTITLDSAPDADLVVNYTLDSASTATLTTDYTVTAGTNISAVTAGSFTILAGQTSATLNINALTDGVTDPNETVILKLATGAGYQLVATSSSSFATKVDYGTGTSPASVSMSDFNSDGKLDLVVANISSNTVSVLLGTGTGTFAAKVDYGTGASPYSVSVGDFNSDGKLDLAVANAGSNTVSVLLGTGTGTFAAKVDYVTGANPYSVSTGDFNGDSQLDLAVANAGNDTVSVLLGTGTGAFAAKVDYGTGTSPALVSVGDLNGDGKLDLAVTNFNSGTVSVLLGTGTGTGTFAAKVDYGTGASPYSVSAGDFNGDGKLDLSVANVSSNTVSVLLGTGTGAFAAKVDYGTGTSPALVSVGDLNGDGKLDLAVTNFNSGTVSVLLGTGTGTFAAKVDYGTGASPISVSVGDFNGDGKLDLAVANASSNSVSVLLNNAVPSATLTITDVLPNIAPMLGGTFTIAGTVNDNVTTTPFSAVTVSDAENNNVSIHITYNAANGPLSGTGLTGSAGNYTLTSASLTTVQSELQTLVFHPTANQVAVGATVQTTFTLTPNDGTVNGTADATTVITATSINDAPSYISDTVLSINNGGLVSSGDLMTTRPTLEADILWDGTGVVNATPVLIYNGNPALSGYGFIGQILANGTMDVYILVGGVAANPVANITANTWTHIGISLDASNVYQYAVGSTTGAIALPLPNLQDTTVSIVNSVTGVFPMNGQVDNIAVWNTALTSTQMASHGTLLGNETNLAGLWQLENNFTNSVTGGQALTASGSALFAAIPLPQFADIAEDATSSGTTIANLILAISVTDADHDKLGGLAITGNSANASTQGSWQYYNGISWTTISTAVSLSNALQLNTSTALRFVPVANYNGTPNSLSAYLIDNSITFTNASLIDLTGLTGGVNHYSASAVTVGINVIAVNDAPVASGSITLAAINEDNTTPSGATISSLFSGNFSDVIDTVTGGSTANTFAGIAISSYTVDAAKGAWQYQINGAGAWIALPSASTSTAVTLASTDLLRFLPTANYNGAATALTANLIESGTTITSGGVINLISTGTGGITPYSSASVVLNHTITAINDAPTGLGNLTLTAVNENTISPAGAAINTLTGFNFTDADAGVTLKGVAVVGSGSNGWQYSTNGGTNWYNIGAVGITNTLVLAPTTLVRFVPVANYTSAPFALIVKALDDTYAGGFSSTAGTETRVMLDASSNGGTTAIANNSNVINTSITDVNPLITNATVSLNENSVAGTAVTTVFATNDTNGLIYSITSGNTDVDGDGNLAFNINTSTGAITVNDAGDLNFENTPSFSLVVAVDDEDANTIADSIATMTVNLQNLDEVAPTITSSTTATAINENSSAGLVVYIATSTDTGDIATGATAYSLSGIDAALFTINSATGDVTLTANPDYETQPSYSFNVVATDTVGNASSQTVTLAINDVNEVPSVSSGNTASFAENAIGTVYTATGIDPDTAQTLSWSISGTDAALFSINSSSGALTFNTLPNFESPTDNGANNIYDLNVIATDNGTGNLTASKAVAITVTNVNEAPTIFAPESIRVTEDVTSVLTGISFADVDAGYASVIATLAVDSGTLSATDSGGVTVTGSGSASMSLTGSLANINAFIAASAVSFTTDLNSISRITLSTSLNDNGNSGSGGALSSAVSMTTLNVIAIADTPAVASLIINEDIDSGAIAITRNEVDGKEVTHYKITRISGGTLYSDAGFTTAINAGDFIASIGVTTNVYFRPTANADTVGSFTVQASTSNGDAGLGGSTATSTITVTAINDAPTFSGLGNAVNFVENRAAVVLGNAITVSDVDLAPLNYANATLSLMRNGSANAEDVFSNTGTLAALTQGGNLTVGGTVIGTVTANSAGLLSLTFNSNATQVLVNSALQQITYRNSSNTPPASVQINWLFSDKNTGAQGKGASLTATGHTTVTITVPPALNGSSTNDGSVATPDKTPAPNDAPPTINGGTLNSNGSFVHEISGGHGDTTHTIVSNNSPITKEQPILVNNTLTSGSLIQLSNPSKRFDNIEYWKYDAHFRDANELARIDLMMYQSTQHYRLQIAELLPKQVVSALQTFSFDIPASAFRHIDSNAQLTFSAKLTHRLSLPKWLHFDAKTLKFTGTPPQGAGYEKIIVTAKDQFGYEIHKSFTLHINKEKAVTHNPVDKRLTAKPQAAVGKFGFSEQLLAVGKLSKLQESRALLDSLKQL